jgi:cell division protein FtsX
VAHAAGRYLDRDLLVRDWTRQNRTWFAAVQLEKRMMFIILTLIVAVAAFNLVSTLVMTVTDKRADIAILRTLGASPGSIMGVFMVQGAMVGIIGTGSWACCWAWAWPSTSTPSCRRWRPCWVPASCRRTSTSSAACPATRSRPTSCRLP